jgi:hypothetical protein
MQDSVLKEVILLEFCKKLHQEARKAIPKLGKMTSRNNGVTSLLPNFGIALRASCGADFYKIQKG